MTTDHLPPDPASANGMAGITRAPALLARRPGLFIGIALALRALMVLFAVLEARLPDEIGRISIRGGDTEGYLAPVEHLIAHGAYAPDERMPGVAAPYWLFRQFMGIGPSRDALVVLQWLLSGLSAYVLGLLALRITGSGRAALAAYGLFLLSAYSSWYDAHLSSDSLCTSLIILHAWLLDKGVRDGRWGLLALAGACLAWMVFLRPITLPLVALAAALVVRYGSGARRWGQALLVIAPFLIADAAWVVRNWRVHGRFVPLTPSMYLAEYTGSIKGHLADFVRGYGGNYIWWHPGADIRWYGIVLGGDAVDDGGRRAASPPPHALADGYGLDSLVALSERIRLVESGALAAADSASEAESIIRTIDRYAAAYRAGRPFQFHVMSRLRMLRNIFSQHGGETIIYRAWAELPLFHKAFKLLQIAIYLFSYGLALPALLFFAWRWRGQWSLPQLLIPGVLLYLALVHPLGLRLCEFRYLVHPFPFALLLSACFAARAASAIRQRIT